MKNGIMISVGKVALFCLAILLSLGFYGCGNMGQVASIDNRLLVSEQKSNQGTYKDGELTLLYNYSLTGDTLNLTGTVYYRGGVDWLNVFILFLDPTGTVLQRKIIYSSGYRVYPPWEAERKFQEKLIVPHGATGISFSYFSQPRSSHK